MAPIAHLTVRLSAQIAEFQQEFREAAKSAQTFQQQFQGVVGRVGALASGLVAGIGVIGLTNFIRDIANAAGKTVDLSNKLGISIEAVQRLSYVAGQTGTTVDAFGNAIHQLGVNLAGNDRSAVAAVEKLGFAFHELRRLKPEEQFHLLAQALERVSDPQERARLAQELFGRQARQILPAIAEGYAKLATEATIASDEQVRALDKAGDAVDRARNHFAGLATQALGEVVIASEKAEVGVNKFADSLNDSLQRSPGWIGWITRYNAGLREAEAAANDAATALNKLTLSAPALPTQPGLGPAGNLSFKDLLAISNGFTTLKQQTDAAKRAQQLFNEEWRKFREEEQRQIESSNRNREAWEKYPIALRDTDEALKNVSRHSIDMLLVQSRMRSTLHESGLAWVENEKAMRAVELVSFRLAENYKGSGWFASGGVQADIKKTTINVGELSQALANLAQVSGGTLGSIAQGLSTIVSAIDTAHKSVEAFQKGWENKGSIAGIASLASGILGIVSAAIAAVKAIKGIFDAFDRNKGRDLVVDFAADFGGFDALQRKLQDTFDPATAERYWIALTQGVGRNNPEQARKVIDDINAAFGRHSDRLAGATAILAEYGLTWEDAGAKFRNANLASQFDALFEKTQTLKEIGVDYNVVLEKQAGEYSNLLQAALRTGSEIPIAFKPILEDLLLAGKLLREDGTAFDDLGDVSWAKTLTQGFKDVTTAIYDLRDALVGGVGGALDDLSRRRVDIPIRFDVGEIALPSADFPHLKHGGIVRRPTLALVGESGPEAVVPLSQLGAAQAGSSRIILEVDGRTFAEVMVPHLPGAIRRRVHA